MASMIRFPRKEDRLRALEAFLEVREAYVVFADRVLGVTEEHVKALKQAVPPIDFEYVSKPPVDGKKTTSLQP